MEETSTNNTKHIFKTENGDIEFANQSELERYFSGEKPNLELVRDGYYKATFTPSQHE